MQRITVLISVLFFVAPLHAAEFDPQQFGELSRSVLKIYVEYQDRDRDAIATGFLYQESRFVVTAMHPLIGASQIQVKYPNGGAVRNATVIKWLRDADLALLEISDPIERNPLELTNIEPDPDERVIALGYPVNTQSVVDTSLTLHLLQKTLADIISNQVQQEFDRLGFPKTTLRIISLGGNPLLPGNSGCPIFNRKGQIIAIGNGGLMVGAASRSWAIPASHVRRLHDSNDGPPRQHSKVASLFAAEIAVEDRNLQIEPIAAGGGRLLHIANRSHTELISTTDDPIGVQQIVSTFFPINPNHLRFDIYRDQRSSSVMVVPEGSDIYFDNDHWFVTDHEVELVFAVDDYQSPSDLQFKSLEFERFMANRDQSVIWQENPNWSYPFPRPTLTGMIVRRKGIVGWGASLQGPFAAKQIVQTFSAYNGALLSAAARNGNNFRMMHDQAFRQRWLAYTLSAFFSTLGN